MKRFVLIFTLLFTAIAGAQVINIPNPVFKSLLVTSAQGYNQVAKDSSGFIAVDANADGQIDQEEAEEVRELYLDGEGITSVEGIQYFVNLRILYVADNNLGTFNATPLEDLEELYINGNQLTVLTLAGSHHLKILNCSDNQLSTLTFAGTEYLQRVNCSYNNLTQLDFSACPALTELNCANNNITYINIKNGAVQTSDTANNLWAGNLLAYMCIDDNEADVINTLLGSGGYPPSVVANSFCTFVPGGAYNTITGKLTFDIAGNGCTAADPSQKFMKVTTSIGAETCAVFTDANGEYDIYTLAGSFNVTPQFEENYFTATPSVGSVNFLTVNNQVATADFCIAPTTAAPDIEIVMVPIIAPVPGGIVKYKMVYRNKGNQVLNGAVQCTWNFNKFYIDMDSFSPYASDIIFNGNEATYVWEYTNLQPFESRVINIEMEVNGPADVVPVNVGDPLIFSAEATLAGDVLMGDNSVQLVQQAVASVSTADITCIEGTSVPVSYVGEYLHYVVNFTNEGAQTANNIVVETLVDPADFDVATLQVLNSSHPANARVAGNNIRFIMQAADLASNGHGNILFKAKTKSNLTMGTTVSSAARIYYNYNSPVDTNTATTQFGVMGTGNVTADALVNLYPNPVKDVVNIESVNAIQQVNLYDVQGRLLQTDLINTTQMAIDLSPRAAGIYFVKVFTTAGVKVQKIVKQ